VRLHCGGSGDDYTENVVLRASILRKCASGVEKGPGAVEEKQEQSHIAT